MSGRVTIYRNSAWQDAHPKERNVKGIDRVREVIFSNGSLIVLTDIGAERYEGSDISWYSHVPRRNSGTKQD